MTGVRHSRSPDFVHIDAGDPDHAVRAVPIEMAGVSYLPATSWRMASIRFGASDGWQGCLMLGLPTNIGLHLPMTAATMRALATRLETMAGEIESTAAGQARAALAKAAGRSS